MKHPAGGQALVFAKLYMIGIDIILLDRYVLRLHGVKTWPNILEHWGEPL